MARSFLIFTVCLLFASGVDAADYATMGQGAQRCFEFTRFYSVAPESAEEVFFNWAQGFMSGINTGNLGRNTLKNLDSIPIEDQQRLIHEYCNNYPTDTYSRAVANLYSRLENSAH